MALRTISAKEAARLIKHNDHVAFSGFTHAGCPKAVPLALSHYADEEHAAGREFKIGVFTGASTGDNIDGALARAHAVKFRTPYQTNKDMRNAINDGEVPYFDLHLSTLAQDLRYGFYGPLQVAVIEASDVTVDGEIVPTSGVGMTATIARMADLVIVERNSWHPKELRGLHDLYEPADPPRRREIPLYGVRDRIGSDHVKVDPDKIVVVETCLPNDGGGFAPIDETTARIGRNAADFFVREMDAGRLPEEFLPVQSGVGNIANAVLAAMGDSARIPDFEIYTEVIQDAVIDLMESGRVRFASGGTLTVSNPVIQRIYDKLDWFRQRLILRSSEISNHPEIARRLGVIAMNTAIEADIFGNVNSTHIMGSRMMNGLGGSGDFTRNAYLSIFLTPSTAKDGRISSIVPMVSHEDHSEHSVKIIVTEHGVADLRMKSPRERAECLIEHCAHPDYRPLLRRYLEHGSKGQTPVDLRNAFAFHEAFLERGDMRDVHWR